MLPTTVPANRGAGCLGWLGCGVIVVLGGIVGFAMLGLMLKGLFT